MTAFLTTTFIGAIAFGALMAMRRGSLGRVQPIQAILRLRQRRPQKSASSSAAKKAGKFHAVTIEMDRHPCSAVRPLEGQTFLSRDAPLLPLAECDQAACKCRFVHHEDRRNKLRRGYQSDLGRVAALGSNEERRGRAGRREGDLTDLE